MGMASKRTFVIVGASLAGAKAAETLRAEGFDGRVVLVGEERERPYERPALSKEYVRGGSEREGLFVHPASFYEEQEIELRTSTRVNRLDPPASEVVLGNGERLRFDRLLLATGAQPRRLRAPGADLDGVLSLRTLADADAIAARIARGGRLVVVGGGWIGAEIAASARQSGLEVTMVEQGRLPLERVLGPEVATIYRDAHLDHGVELLVGTGLQALEGDGRVERVVTSDGRRIDCDVVVVGIGVEPRSELAALAGLQVDRGILVDERLETSTPGIFAAGDVTNAAHPLYEGRLHVEHWSNALHQGPTAAKNMLGQDEAYARLPYFYSDQYELGMEYRGHATRWDEVVFRGDPAGREFLAFWLSGNRVVAGMNVNVWNLGRPIQTMIRERVPVDAGRLRDPDVPLEEIASARTVPRAGPPDRLLRAGPELQPTRDLGPAGEGRPHAGRAPAAGRGEGPRRRRREDGRLPRMSRARCMRSRPSARTWAASSTSTPPSAPGTARATVPASPRRGRS